MPFRGGGLPDETTPKAQGDYSPHTSPSRRFREDINLYLTSPLQKGDFYLFFIRLPEIFVAVL